jgi:hypothetical protein
MQKIKLLSLKETIVFIKAKNKTTISQGNSSFYKCKKSIKKYRTHDTVSLYESSPPATTVSPSFPSHNNSPPDECSGVTTTPSFDD